MTQEHTGVSEGASVQATPATPPTTDPTPPTADQPLHPADSSPSFTLEAAKEQIDQMISAHDADQAQEHRRPVGIELGKKQIQDLLADLEVNHGATGPVLQLHGLQVVPVNDPDHVALVYSGVAGA